MFQYHSEQVHNVTVNGKSSTRKNVVNIRNGKGTKSLSTNGKTKSKPLSKKEIQCIQKGKFIPNLFNDCVKPLRPNATKRQKRNK
jgi:hypothetical protein